METRRVIVALIASVAVFYIYMALVAKFMPPPRPATQPAASQVAESRPGGPEPTSSPATSQAAATRTAGRSGGSAAEQVIVEGGKDTASITLGNAAKGNAFPMALQLTPRGGAVESVEIRDYYMTVARKQPYLVLSPLSLPDEQTGEMEDHNSFVTSRIRFENLHLEAKLDELTWKVGERTSEKVVFEATIKTLKGSPLARVLKTYELKPQPAPAKGIGLTYDVGLSVTIENLSGGDLDAILTQQGPMGFRKEDPRSEDRMTVVARWEKGKFLGKSEYRANVLKNPAKFSAKDDDAEQMRVAWAAETNKFFTCIMAPAKRLNAEVPAEFAVVEPLVLRQQISDLPGDLTYRFVTRPLTIAAGGSRQVGFDCYIGPKSKTAFDTVPAYRNRDYYDVIRVNFSACAPDALTALMMSLLATFHRIPPHNYGVAIIILVILVRTLLHPLTKKSQVNMMKVQQQQASLQPKIKAIREKYANDKVKMNQATMDLYREEGINPAGSLLSCLPMMLQMPIWIALWTALASTIEMRHAPFDGWWIRDLAGPDIIYTLPQPIPIPIISSLMGGPIDSIRLLPILLCISQALQTLYMPKSTTPQPEGAPDQRKMMLFMSPLMMLILWNAPSGLNLYIMASNLFGILEQQRIRKHIKELEARRPEEEAKRRAKAQEQPRGWFGRKWAELAREIEDAKKLQSGRDKKGGANPKEKKRD